MPRNTRTVRFAEEGKGLASYCKAETTFTFHFSILTLSNAFLGIDNREMKNESGFSFAIASQPFKISITLTILEPNFSFGNVFRFRKILYQKL